MKLETIMANIIIDATRAGRQNASAITDKNDRRLYSEAYQTALNNVTLGLGRVFKKMKPEIKMMEVIK